MSISYQAVAEAVILRDTTEPEYINQEHKMLVDIADAFYNADLEEQHLKPEYKKLFNEYSKDFWEKVFTDIQAIESQLDGHENELIEDYKEMIRSRK